MVIVNSNWKKKCFSIVVIFILGLSYYQFNKMGVFTNNSPTLTTSPASSAATHEDTTVTTPPQDIKYDVLLNSYMRGGSTLSGIVLGHRDDVFYLYEPLWKIARWIYFRGNSTVCRADRYDCREVAAHKTLNDTTHYKNPGRGKIIVGTLEQAKAVLNKFYDCQFDEFNKQVMNKLLVRLGGPSWDPIKACIKQRGENQQLACTLKYGPLQCNTATHRVTKVLRLTTDILGDILSRRENLKVFHLFRDPRAIINSRIETGWYPAAKTPQQILDNAHGLCHKMLRDFREGQTLLKKYPARFKFLFYEDLNDEPFKKVRAIYSFVGMSLNESLYTKIKDLSVFKPSDSDTEESRTSNTAFWWRSSLDWNIVKGMEGFCSDVYKEIGFMNFKNIDDFRNLSLNSVHFNPEYLLKV